MRVVADADGFDRYLVDLTARGAEAGPYTLRLNFTDQGNGKTQSTEADVNVEG